MTIKTPIKETIETVLKRIANEPELARKTNLLDIWPSIVGDFFAKHTTARFSKDRKVIVITDDATVAFELRQRYKPVILKRLQNQFGENEIKDVRFIVGELH